MKKSYQVLIDASEAFCSAHKVEEQTDVHNCRTGHGSIFVNGKRMFKKELGSMVFQWYETNYGFKQKWASMTNDLTQWVLHKSIKINNTQL